MADENKNKSPEEKNKIREKEKNTFDQVLTYTQNAFIGANIVGNVARTLKNGNLQHDLDKNKCPPKDEEQEPFKATKETFDSFKPPKDGIEWGEAGKDTLNAITGIIDSGFKSEEFKLEEFPDCLKDEFNQFFNYVPIQYYISKLVADSASTLTNLAINDLREEDPNAPCKEANNEIIDHILNITDNYIPTSLPTIPRIPLIRTNFWDLGLRDVMYALLCEIFTSLISELKQVIAEIIISLLSDFESLLTDANATLVGDRYSDFGLKKVNLNKYVSNEVIITAVNEKLLLADATIITKVRQYFDIVEQEDKILQRQILLLLIGEVECSIINQMIEVNKQVNIGLDTEKKIITFFNFLREQINMIGILENSKDLECIPDFCVETTQKAEQDIKDAIDKYCSLLNPKIAEALNAIKMEDFLEDIGLTSVVSGGTKALLKKQDDNQPDVSKNQVDLERDRKEIETYIFGLTMQKEKTIYPNFDISKKNVGPKLNDEKLKVKDTIINFQNDIYFLIQKFQEERLEEIFNQKTKDEDKTGIFEKSTSNFLENLRKVKKGSV